MSNLYLASSRPPRHLLILASRLPSPDGRDGETLRAQAAAEHAITDVLTSFRSSFASPILQKQTHITFLASLIQAPLPQGYTSLDASRPWIIYWVLHSFALLGGELDAAGKARVVETLMACQSEEGGFGGGPGQLPHLAPTYAAVCALAYAGEEGWARVDRCVAKAGGPAPLCFHSMSARFD